MARRRHLVLQHLENVNGKLLVEYAPVVGDMIRGQSGVYALYRGENLYYVGLAVNLMRRLNQHRKDRHSGKWNRFSVYLMKQGEHIKELESLLLRIASPRGNRTSGRLVGAEDLRAPLRGRIKEHHEEKLSKMMGRSVTRRGKPRRRRVARTRVRGQAAPLPLKDAVRRAKRLRGYYKGYYYFATLYRSGEIEYDGVRYRSATAAAKLIINGAVNGMAFWHIRGADGEWTRLRDHVN